MSPQISQRMYAMFITVACSNKTKDILYTGVKTGDNMSRVNESFTRSVKYRWRSWMRHCATSRKVAGSIPEGVIGTFQ